MHGLRGNRVGRMTCGVVLAVGLSLGQGVSAHAGRAPPPFRGSAGQFREFRPIDRAPDAELSRLDGAKIRLSDLRGRVVVLSFWATWCAACAAELDALDRLAAEAGPDRIAVVAVSLDRSSPATIERFLERRRLPHLDVWIDPEGRLASLGRASVPGALAIWALPTSFVLDRNGGVAGYLVGPAEWDSSRAKDLLRFYNDGSPALP